MTNALYYSSEFLGTFTLILFGNGIGQSLTLKRMFAKGTSPNWLMIGLGWGLAVLLGVLAANFVVQGAPAHLNPAVSLSFFFSSKNLDYKILGLIPIQIIGAFLGQIVLNLINWNHIKETGFENIGGTHFTSPAFPKKHFSNLSYEFIGTVFLMVGIFGFIKTGQPGGPIWPMLIVSSIGLSLGSSTGYAINPARDFGPRLAYFCMGKVLKVQINCQWDYSYVPVVAPILGGILTGLAYRFI